MIEECLRQEDTVARIGGDEFVIILVDLNRPEDLIPIISKLFERLAKPYLFEVQDLHVTGSVGVSIFPEYGAKAHILIRRAGEAFYAAKRSGKNQFRIFGT